MRMMMLKDFQEVLRSQGVPSREHFAFVCPICGTVQSAADLIAAGAGASFDDVQNSLGFACIGRFTNAGAHKPGEPPGRGCNWTLGGLFKLHTIEVEAEDGSRHPLFEPASADAARAHAVRTGFLLGIADGSPRPSVEVSK